MIDAKKENPTSLTFKMGLYSYTFLVSGDYFVYKWSTPREVECGERLFLLSDLSPHIGRDSKFGHGGERFFTRAALCILLSACFFFSDFNKSIPLLAPFLLVAGTIFTVVFCARLRSQYWIIIHKKNGTHLLTLAYRKKYLSAMTTFEKQLSEAITQTKKTTVNQASEATSEPAPSADSSLPQG